MEDEGPQFEVEARARRKSKRHSQDETKRSTDKKKNEGERRGSSQEKRRNSIEREKRKSWEKHWEKKRESYEKRRSADEGRRDSTADDNQNEEAVRRARRSSLPPNELIYSSAPTWSYNFVDYFLKSEGGVPIVLSLSEAKQEYEKKCEVIIAKMSQTKKDKAEEFFNKIIEAIQVKLPESEVTNINSLHNYNLKREIQSILEALKIDASKELHNIKKYHEYVQSVEKYAESKCRDRREPAHPEALIDIDTHLLAGIMTRFYPIFSSFKEMLENMAENKDSPSFVKSDECVHQLKKLVLAIYKEIACIDISFQTAVKDLKSTIPRPEDAELYQQELAVRKKHARHSVTWAARCITTVLLHYHLVTEMA